MDEMSVEPLSVMSGFIGANVCESESEQSKAAASALPGQ